MRSVAGLTTGAIAGIVELAAVVAFAHYKSVDAVIAVAEAEPVQRPDFLENSVTRHFELGTAGASALES